MHTPFDRLGRWGFALSRSALVLTIAISGIVFAGEGCDCNEVLIRPDAGGNGPLCDVDEPCGENLVRRHGQCVDQECTIDSDCCPGHRCREDFGVCWPKQFDGSYACEADEDCPDVAMRCLEVVIGDRDPVNACTFARCEGSNDCRENETCFQSVCVKSAPCGGGCPEGEVCDVLTNACSPVGPDATGCSGTCDGLLVLQDPDGMSGEKCCNAICQCAALPPILPIKFGKYASVATAPNEVLVSAYDSEYGDLVLVHYGKTGSTLTRVDYIDGVPATGAVTGSRTGPRAGVIDPGPNVGTFTSLDTNAQGLARIAYHDVDNRALKVAIMASNGTFSTHTVEAPTSDGRIGEFASIAVNPPTGQISIAYLVTGVSGLPGVAGSGSALKVARSLNDAPASAADWEIITVDARGEIDPCTGTCAGNQACVLDGDIGCRNFASTCPDTCSENETCVILSSPDADGNTTGCAQPPLPRAHPGLPRARGIHPAVIYDGTDTLVAYYDSIDGDLRAARISAAGAPTTYVVDGDGEAGRSTGDVGRHPTLARTSSGVIIAYADFARHRLRAFEGQLGMPGTYSVIDNGIAATPGKHFVGADARIRVVGGATVVVYQDATTLDLKYARQDGGAWVTETLASDGATGFYSDIAVEEGIGYIVHVTTSLDSRETESPRLNLLSRSVP